MELTPDFWCTHSIVPPFGIPCHNSAGIIRVADFHMEWSGRLLWGRGRDPDILENKIWKFMSCDWITGEKSNRWPVKKIRDYILHSKHDPHSL